MMTTAQRERERENLGVVRLICLARALSLVDEGMMALINDRASPLVARPRDSPTFLFLFSFFFFVYQLGRRFRRLRFFFIGARAKRILGFFRR